MTVLVGVVVAVNLAAFAAFAIDKWSAQRRRRRIPESVLLFLAFAGGSPSAKFAQAWLRHKTRKQPFAARLNAIILAHLLILTGLFVFR